MKNRFAVVLFGIVAIAATSAMAVNSLVLIDLPWRPA